MKAEAKATTTLGEDRSAWPEVSIIILNWNNYEDTAQCLHSIKDVDYPNYETVVVDNGSSDKSGKKLAENFTWCQFVHTEKNLGFAGGCNKGVNEKGKTSDYCLFLNNDARVSAGVLMGLVATAEANERVAGVTGVIRQASDGSVWSAGEQLNDWFVRSNAVTDVPNQTYTVDFASGALLLTPLETFNELNKFDEDFFFGFEDRVYGREANNNNYNIYVNPNVTIKHKVSATTGRGSPFRYYHATRNRLEYAGRYLNPLQKLVFSLFFIFSRVLRSAQWVFHQNGPWEKMHAIILGVLDQISGSTHKKPEFFGIGGGT
jgi:GT2 family glycosyltransferase